ncbi:MAG TPA: tetratricopeptide repeat protein [Candidatus Nitrosocosmicus sp.]|nr:tetratricopeptide repeat protein [Candidatus Nitrosocosmicus sp.]
MSNDDWFRSNKWDKKAQELFETKLKRSRGSFHKAQYLRIKALALLDTKDKTKQKAGQILLERLIKKYSTETDQVMLAYEELGQYYEQKKDLTKAEECYRKSVEVDTKRKSVYVTRSYFFLARLLYELKEPHKIEEASELVEAIFSKNRSFPFYDENFELAALMAKIAAEFGDIKVAVSMAKKALKFASFEESQFSRHPEVGIVKSNSKVKKQLEEMKVIINKYE